MVMPATAVHKSADFAPVTHALSVGGLADRLGVPRQRIYNLVRNGYIRVVVMSGGQVIPVEEANRVLEAAIKVSTREGRDRIVFNFI
jgi:predicted site-specific integrase-resolvase